MIKRLTTATAVLAGAAVMAVSGVAIAQSGTGAAHKKATHHVAKHATKHATRANATETTGPDTDSIQSGDQTTPDTASASASETSSGEASSETVSDGPGGHEDEPGSEVDHQFEGEE